MYSVQARVKFNKNVDISKKYASYLFKEQVVIVVIVPWTWVTGQTGHAQTSTARLSMVQLFSDNTLLPKWSYQIIVLEEKSVWRKMTLSLKFFPLISSIQFTYFNGFRTYIWFCWSMNSFHTSFVMDVVHVLYICWLFTHLVIPHYCCGGTDWFRISNSTEDNT